MIPTIDCITDAEKYIDGVDAVIFDLDDTLYSEKDYVRSGYKKVAEHLGRPELVGEKWSVFETGGKAIDEVLEKYALLSRKEEALRVYRFQKPDIALYPGVRDMIERMKKTRKVGIITDGRPEGQNAKILALGIEVDAYIVTDELGGAAYRKPNAAAFQLMQKKLEVPFCRMVYIGDNPKKDFIAPEKLGMISIYFRNRDGLYSG